MSVTQIDRWTQEARQRGAWDDALTGAPLVLLTSVAAWRLGGVAAVLGVMALGVAVLAGAALWRGRRFDRTWIVRRLDGLRPELEDSSDLLAVDRDSLTPLQQLQYDRVRSRLAAAQPDLRPAWSTRRIAIAWTLGGLAVLVLLLWPRAGALAPAQEGAAPPPGVPHLVGQRLHVIPPAYTGLPPRDLASLDGQVPLGSRLEWTLRFAPQPIGAQLVVMQGPPLGLKPAGKEWTANLTLDHSLLYRVVPRAGSANGPLHRLDALPDAPPEVKVLRPAQGLTLVTPGQKSWTVAFEATDDYGVAPEASLRLTVAEGDGEEVKFHERTLVLRGEGTGRRRQFTTSLDFATLGFQQGGDLVAQLIVTDNRAPSSQSTSGPSLILRWPAKVETMGEGLDAAVKKELPAYLRSERQVIIDAEELLKDRGSLTPARFLSRSDSLGADQQGLRLRYSQFLGGEKEKAENALPISDDDDAPAAKPAKPGAPASAPAAPPRPATANAGFGVEVDVLHDYGHAHDDTESSAVDPSSRAKLKLSVDQMFQAETHLREGDPAGALPFAEKALAFLKEAQQAERIYVPHASSHTPPIDLARRLTGKRDGLTHGALDLAPADAQSPVPAAAWRALGEAGGSDPTAVLTSLEAWLRTDPGHGVDPLAFASAIDAVRRDPGCGPCRATLRGLVWTALTPPPPHVARRPEVDAAGRRYLDALSGAPAR
jgi:hypothetical protein